jgi:hypothetical protein
MDTVANAQQRTRCAVIAADAAVLPQPAISTHVSSPRPAVRDAQAGTTPHWTSMQIQKVGTLRRWMSDTVVNPRDVL